MKYSRIQQFSETLRRQDINYIIYIIIYNTKIITLYNCNTNITDIKYKNKWISKYRQYKRYYTYITCICILSISVRNYENICIYNYYQFPHAYIHMYVWTCTENHTVYLKSPKTRQFGLPSPTVAIDMPAIVAQFHQLKIKQK